MAIQQFISIELGVISGKTKQKTLRILDFDETIAKTNSKVGVTEFNTETGKQLGSQYYITPAEYAVFKKTVGLHPEIRYEYDYHEFVEVKDPKIIEFTFNILRKVVHKVRKESAAPAVILTARGHDANENISNFLRSFNINVPVITLNSSDPERKSTWIKQAMLSENIPRIEFFDDSPLNIKAVADLNSDKELMMRFGDTLKVCSRLIKAL